MKTNEAYLLYQEKLQELILIREKNKGQDSEEEERNLEKMDSLWWKMSDQERKLIDSIPPSSRIEREKW